MAPFFLPFFLSSLFSPVCASQLIPLSPALHLVLEFTISVPPSQTITHGTPVGKDGDRSSTKTKGWGVPQSNHLESPKYYIFPSRKLTGYMSILGLCEILL